MPLRSSGHVVEEVDLAVGWPLGTVRGYQTNFEPHFCVRSDGQKWQAWHMREQGRSEPAQALVGERCTESRTCPAKYHLVSAWVRIDILHIPKVLPQPHNFSDIQSASGSTEKIARALLFVLAGVFLSVAIFRLIRTFPQCLDWTPVLEQSNWRGRRVCIAALPEMLGNLGPVRSHPGSS